MKFLLLLLPAIVVSRSVFGISDDLRGVLLDIVTIEQFPAIQQLIQDVENGVIHLYYWGTKDEDVETCATAILELETLIEDKKEMPVNKKEVDVNAITQLLNTLRQLLTDKSYFDTKGRIGSLVSQVVPKIEDLIHLAYPDD